jgi:hypothetical protein
MNDVDPIRVRDLLGHMVDAQRRLRELGTLPTTATPTAPNTC